MYSGFDGFKIVDDDYLGFVEYYKMMKQQSKKENINDVFYQKCLHEWNTNLKSLDKNYYINSIKMKRKMNKDYFNEYMFQFENYCRQIKQLPPLKQSTDFLHYTYDQKQDFQNNQLLDDSPKKVLAIGKVFQVHEIEKQLKLRIAQDQYHFKREEKYQLIGKEVNIFLNKGQQQNN